MNSAPVQLLPIDNGSGIRNKITETDKPEIKGESFDDVLEAERNLGDGNSRSVKAENKTKKQAKDTAEISNEKTKKEKIELSGKKTDTNEETTSEQLKKVLLSDGRKKAFESTVSKNASKKTDGKNLEKKPGNKSDNKLEITDALLSASMLFPGKSVGPEEKSGVKSAADHDGKAAASLKKGQTSALFTEGGALAEALKNAAGKHSALEAAPKKQKSGDKSKLKKVDPKTAELKKDKLKITDHRRGSAAVSHKGVKLSAVTDAQSQKANLQSGNDFEPSAKVLELNAFGDESKELSPRSENMQNIRHTQSSVLSQLRESVNSQIVKQAGIVVKGNGTGEIKLVMKPESLGKVRIQLSLNDNHIAGRIIVENNIVREIFESNLENLYKAFGSEGFEAGRLDVCVQGDGRNGDKGGRKNGRNLSDRAVKAMEEAVPVLADSEWRDNSVNMVV